MWFDGKMIKANMHKELLTKDELMSHLREEGVSKLSDVKVAYIEGDGKISVCKYEGK